MLHRIVAEWRLPMFGIIGTNGKKIDPTPDPNYKRIWIAIKIALLTTNAYGVIQSLIYEEPSKIFWTAFFTHWASTVSTIYLISSFLSLVLFRKSEKSGNDVSSSTKVTWGLFATAINMELFVTILFWLLVYGGDPLQFHHIYEHGVLLFVVAIDGYIVHRFPIRFKQIAMVYFVEITYLLWTVIHALSGIGNPAHSDNDPESDDDALYASINWDKRPQDGTILVVMLLFIGIPIMFLITWAISLLVPREILDTEEKEEEDMF